MPTVQRPLSRLRKVMADLLADRPPVGCDTLTILGVRVAAIVPDVRLPGVLVVPSPAGLLAAVNVPGRRALVTTPPFDKAVHVLGVGLSREAVPDHPFGRDDLLETTVFLARVYARPGDVPEQARRTGLTLIERLYDAMNSPWVALYARDVLESWRRGKPVPLGKLTRTRKDS